MPKYCKHKFHFDLDTSNCNHECGGYPNHEKKEPILHNQHICWKCGAEE